MSFERGDIVMVNLNPVKGHEQGNYRPVLVLNKLPLPSGINIVAPITSKQKSYPLEVMLDERTKTQGCILCFQLRTLDLVQRGGKKIESIPTDILENCLDFCNRIFV